MSYKYETQHNSPNYTPASQAVATWGRPRTIEAIAIHWWGDPNQGPTYEGVIATLVNPNRGASAHFVVTGTGRRAACLVNLSDASWATNSANPYTISIECDPRCRDEDYDVVAEVIAQIRDAYGNLPLVPHRQFVATQCPGNYDLGRLDNLARTKDGSGDWGDVKAKNAPAPAPVPVPVKEAGRETFAAPKKFKFNKDSRLYKLLEYTPVNATVYAKDSEIELYQKLVLTNGNTWFRTKYSAEKEIGNGFRAEDVVEVVAPAPTPTPTPTPDPKPETPPVEPTPQEPEKPSEGGFTQSDRTMLEDIWKAVQWLVERFKTIFK